MLAFDASNYHTEMCDISMKLNSDKSPFNNSGHYGHRHAYTGIYHYLFKDLREKNFCGMRELNPQPSDSKSDILSS